MELKPQTIKMMQTLAEITYKSNGCKQYGTVCPKGYNGILKPLKTISECYNCIKANVLEVEP